jgi:transposase-like protein
MKRKKTRKRYKRYPAGVRESALERLELGVNVSELAEQLGLHRCTLYYWKRQALEAAAGGKDPLEARDYRIRELESQVAGLEAELGRAELERRFFEAALRRIEESRQSKGSSGETASSPRSATGRTRKAD